MEDNLISDEADEFIYPIPYIENETEDQKELSSDQFSYESEITVDNNHTKTKLETLDSESIEVKSDLLQITNSVQEVKNVEIALSKTKKELVKSYLCDKRMPKKKIRKHTKSTVQLYQCEDCNKVFDRLFALEIHQNVHVIKEFKCSYCNAEFRFRKYLNDHIKRHFEEKPYKCDVCSACFSQKGYLADHMLIHSNERPIKCTICARTFKRHQLLSAHLRRHNTIIKYRCDVCGKFLATSEGLSAHSRKHTGERPYSCNICSQTFTRGNSLRQHSILHSGEKPYKCRFCDVAFAQSPGRRSHERSVHKDKKQEKNILLRQMKSNKNNVKTAI